MKLIQKRTTVLKNPKPYSNPQVNTSGRLSNITDEVFQELDGKFFFVEHSPRFILVIQVFGKTNCYVKARTVQTIERKVPNMPIMGSFIDFQWVNNHPIEAESQKKYIGPLYSVVKTDHGYVLSSGGTTYKSAKNGDRYKVWGRRIPNNNNNNAAPVVQSNQRQISSQSSGD
jgi:hypothetical protein